MEYDPNFDKNQRPRKPVSRGFLGRIIALALVVLVCLLVVAVLIDRNPSSKPTEPQISTTPSTTTRPAEPTQPQNPTDTIQLVFGGDLVVNDAVVQSGWQDGRYDYTAMFMDIVPILSAADGAGLNFEGNAVGQPYGGFTASAPAELLNALSHAGVDLLQLANSQTVANGILGIRDTLQSIQQAGMLGVGAYADKQTAEAEQGFTLCNIGGLKVALVGFTKGFDGLSLPQNSQWCTNLLYTDYATNYQKIAEKEIKQILKNVEAQQPDVTIALLHWGSTYNDILRDSQKKIEKLMLENGVDAIIGTHSHYVQEVKFDPEAGTVVAYSLGDFFSGGQQNGSHYSILLQLEVTRNNLTGETKITACDYVPVYTLTPERDGESMRLVRIEAAIEQYENRHINRVNSTAYQNLLDALERIRSRVGF